MFYKHYQEFIHIIKVDDMNYYRNHSYQDHFIFDKKKDLFKILVTGGRRNSEYEYIEFLFSINIKFQSLRICRLQYPLL